VEVEVVVVIGDFFIRVKVSVPPGGSDFTTEAIAESIELIVFIVLLSSIVV